ncbi:MAG: S26 family signal peptidase [Bacteroidales bacterium]|nr:S26 family signal peptidase [Bacteroidales bacterium]
MNFLKSDYFKFGLVSVLYILWVIWLKNFWFLLGLGVIFDIYITKKVNWSFWKKREGKNSMLIEWLDALIFAVIAVTLINIFLFQNYKIPTGSMEKSLLIGDHLYVSKVAYGPRIPNTPLSFPFAQHTLPLTKNTKSYVEWIKLPYKRLAGFGKVKRDDPVVFNFPAGDTVCVERQNVSYYSIVREQADNLKYRDIQSGKEQRTNEEYYNEARKLVWQNYEIVVRPIDRRDNYIKRCIGIPGDSIEIINGVVFQNGKEQKTIPGLQYMYRISTNGTKINPRHLDKLGISEEDAGWGLGYEFMNVPLTSDNVEKIKELKNVTSVIRYTAAKGVYDNNMFPHDTAFKWNLDNYGPFYIPEAGKTIKINLQNLPLFNRIIGYYEGNNLQVKDGKIFINGKETYEYTFKMDYYWMMGDNRHSSLDSRYWGYVPEDHIVGKPKFIWLSLDKDKRFPKNIRIRRMFKGIH